MADLEADVEEGIGMTGIKEASLESCRLEKREKKSNSTIALIFLIGSFSVVSNSH